MPQGVNEAQIGCWMPAGKKRHSLPKNLSQLFATKNGWYIKMYHYTGFHPVNHDKVKKITKDSYCKSPRHVLPTLFTKEGFSSPQSYFHRLYRGGWSEAKVPNDRGRCQPLLFWSRTRRTYDVEDWGSLLQMFHSQAFWKQLAFISSRMHLLIRLAIKFEIP